MYTSPNKRHRAYKDLPRNSLPDTKYWVILFTTIILFIGLTVTLFVSLALADDENQYGGPSGGNYSGNKNNDSGNAGSNKQPSTGSSSKNNISLPSATAGGGYLSTSASSASEIDNISSQCAILVDIGSNTSLAHKNADVKIYPASMTKVMTLLVACERAQSPTAVLTLTEKMVEKYSLPENKGGSLAFEWEAGNQVSVEDALYMVIYESDTYACWLLADYIAGSEEGFVEMMNAKARSMGLSNTHFTNCTGLYNDNHYTTCREMAAIMAAAMKNPTAKAVITKTSLYAVDLYENGKKTGETVEMWSGWYTGRLEAYKWNAQTAAYYVGEGSDVKIIAGKTGYESTPTNCFVTAAVDTETGKEYVCVQVGRIEDSQTYINVETSTRDTRKIYQKYAK